MKRFLKSIPFMILLIAASTYMGFMLQRVYFKGASLFDLSYANIYLALWGLLAMALILMTASLVAVLVRPFWLAIISYLLSGGALFLMWGKPGYMTAFASIAYVVVLMIFDKEVSVDLRERIRFSIQPFHDRKTVLVIFLVIMLCLSFYFGYIEITRNEGFKLPGLVTLIAIRAAEGMVGEEQGLEGEERLKAEINSRIETGLQRAGRIYLLVVLMLTVIVFTIMELLVSLLFWIPILILSLIFLILAKLKVTKKVEEMKEVSKIALG